MNNPVSDLISTSPLSNQLISLIAEPIASLGYQIIHIEVQSHRQKTLRIYIDHLVDIESKGIGIEDCVRVSKTLDEQLDQIPELQTILPGNYEFEVSSPGVDRPLRTAQDFQRFAGRRVRIHTYRPLTIEEIENGFYQNQNPKQKNFLGTLVALQDSKVVLAMNQKEEKSQRLGKKSQAKKLAKLTTNSAEDRIWIPLPLISKANLEPEFDFEEATKESHEL